MTTEATGAVAQRRMLPILFTLTIFTSALLLFFVQPLFTRMILPQIGGAPAVWTTAMLFFQTVLIGGYLYAHVLSKHVPVTLQIAIHIGLLLLALLFLPLAVPDTWRYDATRPVVTQTLWLYALGVGLPFAVLSANAPLIQSWYRRSGGPSADDPYFLYAASNLGSLIALLAFPLIAEPLFGMSAVSRGWSVGFVALGPLLLLSGLAARGRAEPQAANDATPERGSLSVATLARWAFLAFLPSSLMLCVTTKISTDIGSFPLVWVVPLALYLLTFVLVFSNRSPLTAARLRLLLPAALAVLFYFSISASSTLLGFALLLLAFFAVGLLAHRLLFDARPDARHLTVFYVTMSVGGALGGIFNSLIAPLAFDRLIELPATVALISLLLVKQPSSNIPREIALGLVLAPLALIFMFGLVPGAALATAPLRAGAASLYVFAAIALLWRRESIVITLVAASLGLWGVLASNNLLLEDRSFFGLHVVRNGTLFRQYTNGTTIHGGERISDLGKRPEPIYYYHRNGSLAEVMTTDRGSPVRTVGVVGLGIGGLSCYSKPGQEWHFYEIDQKVVDIALDPSLFTFMSECGKAAKIHLGDARIVLQGQKDLDFDILVIDAYSSDAVPVHLATVEALQLYMDRLAKGGILAFHISNRFYDLSRPLGVAARALGIEARIKSRNPDSAAVAEGDTASVVVVMAATVEDLGKFATDPSWKPIPDADLTPWTDDHADLLSALR